MRLTGVLKVKTTETKVSIDDTAADKTPIKADVNLEKSDTDNIRPDTSYFNTYADQISSHVRQAEFLQIKENDKRILQLLSPIMIIGKLADVISKSSAKTLKRDFQLKGIYNKYYRRY